MNETLEIDGVSLNVLGFCLAPDLTPLLAGSAQRGEDRLVPGSAGVIANPRRITVTVVNLELLIFGDNTEAGVAHPDARTGIYRNLKYLKDNVTDPTGTGDGTRTATLTWQGEAPVTKPVHVLGSLDTADARTTMVRGVLRLSFPEGLFDL